MADITDLLLLQKKLRECDTIEGAGYLLVNDSSRILNYRTAVLWLSSGDGGKVQAVSGLPEPARQAPFNHWVSALCRELHWREQTGVIDPAALAGPLRDPWPEFLATEALWLPLQLRGQRIGGLLLARDQAWRPEEQEVADYWAQAAGHALAGLITSGGVSRSLRHMLPRPVLLIIVLVLFAALWIPVRQTVLATAEVVPQAPVVVRAPVDGVIGKLAVDPNQLVSEGDLLLTLDDTSIRAQIEVVKQELAIARAEYRRADQAAVRNRDASSQLPMLRARIEQREAQVNYAQSLLDRTRVFAESSGLVIIPQRHELEGKPVSIGEKLLVLADPERVEVEIWLSVGDSIPLDGSAEVELYLTVAPETVYNARTRFVNYQAEVSPEGLLAFRSRALLQPDQSRPRIGWRGTAKVYGESVPLYYYLFRRPLAAIRQWLGI